ncbi:MAG: tetratricopeptide repeat protein [Rhodopila sp.]|nr:tetratricopeptide repeat protein [Rhodopila sp.]
MSDTPDHQALAREAVAAAESEPRDVGLLLRAVEMLLRAGDAARAVAFAQNAVQADPASFRAMRMLSGVLDAVGERGEAIRCGQEAVRLDPANAEVRLHLGGLLAAQRRWREAAEHLSVHAVSPAATPRGWHLLSSVLHQSGNTERATEAARHAVAADPNNIDYRLTLASLLCARARYDEALEALVTVLDQAPDNPLLWRVQSGALEALGRLSEAFAAAERAVELASGDPAYRAHLDHIARLSNVPAAGAGPAGDTARWLAEPRRPRTARAPRLASSLGEDIVTRWRIIYAIMLRDIRTRFGHTRLGYLWAIMEPMSHLLTLGMMFYALNHSPPPLGDNMFLFYITGLVPFLMFSHVATDVMSAAEGANAMLQLPIVKRTDVMVAHALRQFATELVVGIIIFSIAALLGHQGLPADLLTAGAAVTLLWLLAVGIGAVNVVVSSLFPSYETFFNALIRLLYFTSGIYYSPIGMPDVVRDWLLWNPVLQGIDLFRSGFFNQYEPHWLDMNYLLAWVVVSIGAGFALERALRARMMVHT